MGQNDPTTTETSVWLHAPYYKVGYLAGWRDAMTEAKGGDWSESFPIWWPEPPAEVELSDE